jgi:predicted NAD/FAD-binding protein
MKVIVMGAGIWGLASACRLHNHARVTLTDVEGLDSCAWKRR